MVVSFHESYEINAVSTIHDQQAQKVKLSSITVTRDTACIEVEHGRPTDRQTYLKSRSTIYCIHKARQVLSLSPMAMPWPHIPHAHGRQLINSPPAPLTTVKVRPCTGLAPFNPISCSRINSSSIELSLLCSHSEVLRPAPASLSGIRPGQSTGGV